ncbi:TniB family NTP-binding protein [Burkholderia lata]|uniref:TniB family NTP-binding protein n=1 Tax=Burkholderia lata (strain ATCC 17760 / DSM 23089 / LMG 22485 / NCIMB 9086 / R18194 / 383) TaxID=482957 RepID=UPI0015833094|nr:TniB family NTP-binding protein [Burkholderia lata]
MGTDIQNIKKDPLDFLATIGLPEDAKKSRALVVRFSIRKELIHYDRFCIALRRIAAIHRQWRAMSPGPRALAFLGHTGTGKTTILKFYVSQFERFETIEGPVVPVLYVVMPSRPTIKNLVQAILHALGDRIRRASAEDRTIYLLELLKQCRVELLIIDEFQHFVDAGQIAEASRATDWLKNLLEASSIVMVVAGLPKSATVLEANPQLTRRFSAHHELRRFDWALPDDRREFAGVLKYMQSRLPLPCPELYSPDFAMRMYLASAGVIDYVAKIIDGAVLRAIERGKSRLGLTEFEQSFAEEVWAGGVGRLNPFHPDAELRDLVGTAEPFWYLVRDVNGNGKKLR